MKTMTQSYIQFRLISNSTHQCRFWSFLEKHTAAKYILWVWKIWSLLSQFIWIFTLKINFWLLLIFSDFFCNQKNDFAAVCYLKKTEKLWEKEVRTFVEKCKIDISCLPHSKDTHTELKDRILSKKLTERFKVFSILDPKIHQMCEFFIVYI